MPPQVQAPSASSAASPAATPAQQAAPTPAAFRVEATNIRPNTRKERHLFFDVRLLDFGIAIYNYSLRDTNDTPEVSSPDRAQLDSNRQLVIVPETGKPKYRKTVAFFDGKTKRRFNAAVLVALKVVCPEVFEPPPAEPEPAGPETMP